MAGDWIPMRIDLADDPAVIAIAHATGMDEYAVVGRLHRLWSWANRHLTTGDAPRVTESWVDRYVATPGFASALLAAGWLRSRSGHISIPNFERWNSQGAKRRLMDTQKKQLQRGGGQTPHREGDASGTLVPLASGQGRDRCPDASGTKSGPEKRREEKSIDPPHPPADPPEVGDRLTPPRAEVVQEAWNGCAPLPRLDRLPPAFRGHLSDRWQDEVFRKEWRAAIAALAKSPFYLGKGKDRFFATLGWFVSERGWAAAVRNLEQHRLGETAAEPAPRRWTAADVEADLAERDPPMFPRAGGGAG